MDLIEILTVTEGFTEAQSFDVDSCLQMQQQITQCMSGLTIYLEKNKNGNLSFQEQQLLTEIQKNLEHAADSVRLRAAAITNEITVLRKGRASGRLYKDIAVL